MILIDANLLVYAHIAEMNQHQRAHTWLNDRFNDAPPVGLPWTSLLAFLRVVTNPRILQQPRTVEQAWAQVEAWLEAPNSWIPGPTHNHQALLGRYLAAGRGGNAVPDAHLAALATEHGLILQSADRGFARFPGLRWENPLDS
ncbi:MAG: PIN domain-containing protein [Candidatus Eremiobacteraeota bacterium]|nr:PIN domain-containing protein [Candidatus Eremiobacteraeota bacterium]MCW5870070.1 PIN domain-containing protein [Candidatus Eremiobacteraeota bacterium]